MAQAKPSTVHTESSFAQFLLDHSFLNPKEHTQLMAEVQGKLVDGNGQVGIQDIVKILLGQKLMSEEKVTQARAAFLNLPYIDLSKYNVPAEVINQIPEESRNFYTIVPFELQGNILKVAVVDPSNLQALEALEFLGQKQNVQIQLYVASASGIEALLGHKKNLTNVVGEALKDIQQKQEIEHTPLQVKDGKPEQQVLEDAPIIKIVDVILNNAVDANASDIHVEPSDNDVRIRYRIDGMLHTFLQLPKNVHSAIISRIKILSNLKIDEQRLPQDGRFHMDFGKRSVDFRVSTLPLMYGEKVVMRLLDKSSGVPTLDQLGIRGKALSWVTEDIKKPHGIFLITGPTGSGKSTTLYSILSLLNAPNVNIVTLEDPIEYFMEGVNQSQINPDIGLTFATGLRSILRQDPNVIMVGEIRDQETAELAVHAALTGHLVFSTLHTNNSVGAIPRLINMGIEPFLLAASMNMIMAQRLVRRLCESCRTPMEVTSIIEKEIRKELATTPADYVVGFDPKKLTLFAPKGCEKCGNTGYKGRMGIYEVLPMLTEIQEMIFAQAPAHTIYEATIKVGMITMKQDGIIKALRGETTLEEIIRVTTE
ncbi:MAG: type II/IV secretion system protein [Candidatus Doudnabacteria bacterium]|nr:type II/IV secretion system protein [Candidatus Doudnabacteria bacterium]